MDWLGAIACQAGIIFMLVGRTYGHEVTVHPTQATVKKAEAAE